MNTSLISFGNSNYNYNDVVTTLVKQRVLVNALQVCGRGSQERMFFLFSDILLYAKKGGSLDKEQR